MGAAVKSKRPVPAEMPAPILLNLAGLEEISGFGDNMRVQDRQGSLELVTRQGASGAGQATSEAFAQGGASGPARVEHASSGRGGPSGAGKGVNASQVLVSPLHVRGAILNGLPSDEEDMGLVLDGVRWHFNTALYRQDDGRWVPQKGAPAQFQYHACTEKGDPAPPAVLAKIFDRLERAVELCYRRRYYDFVMAEWVWLNNTLAEWYTDNHIMNKGKTAKEREAAKKRVIAVRFSKKIAAVKEDEARVREWLKANSQG